MQRPSESSRASLDSQPWWTEADQAELNARTWLFVELAFDHKSCAACRHGWCPVLLEDFDRLLVWRQARIIASKAEFLSALAYERRNSA